MNKKLAEEIRSTINMLLDISGGKSKRERVLEIRKQANETLRKLEDEVEAYHIRESAAKEVDELKQVRTDAEKKLLDFLLRNQVRVPVKKFVDDESLSWEERFNNLNQHHLAETGWLIGQLEKAKVGLDSDETFELACEHFWAACGYPTKEELEEAGAFVEREDRIKYVGIYNAAMAKHADPDAVAFAENMAAAHELALVAVIHAYENDAYRRNTKDLEREVRHAMGHVFQDVLKPQVLGIPCEACTPNKAKDK